MGTVWYNKHTAAAALCGRRQGTTDCSDRKNALKGKAWIPKIFCARRGVLRTEARKNCVQPLLHPSGLIFCARRRAREETEEANERDRDPYRRGRHYRGGQGRGRAGQRAAAPVRRLHHRAYGPAL